MIERKKLQIEIIEEENAETFKQKVNTRISELENVIELSLPEGNIYRAIIKYEAIETIPENAEDRYYNKHNKHYVCNDCPFLAIDPDRRAITHWCNLHKDRTGLKTPCCEEFYEGLLSGKHSIVTHEERMRQRDQADKEELERRKEYARITHQISVDKRNAAKYELAETVKKPRYCFQYSGYAEGKYKCMHKQFLLAGEIAYIVNGKYKELTDEKLIAIAEKTNAETLLKKSSLLDEAATCIYRKDSVKE